MPLQATSGAASYDAFGGGAAVAPKYIEDFFQTWLRTGTGSSATVTTGLNASINKSLVWTKSRSAATNHKLTDTVRGATKALSSNTTSAEATDSQGLTAFSSTGYTIGTNTDYNNSGATYVDWQWLATPKFFDVVTWSGDNTSPRSLPHSLDSVPGFVAIKCTSSASNWICRHRSLGDTPNDMTNNTTDDRIFLNLTNAAGGSSNIRANASTLTVGGASDLNASGETYVAYLFAHNAGGFGLTGTDNVISCGSFTANGSGAATVDLGYEPQWILWKASAVVDNWNIFDNMRGMPVGGTDARLFPNLSNAENLADRVSPTATGFNTTALNASEPYIYIAIRRGPMKVPTTGTSVYNAIARTGTGSAATVTGVGFPTDLVLHRARSNTLVTPANMWQDRLRGIQQYLKSNNTNQEFPDTSGILSLTMDGMTVGTDGDENNVNIASVDYINYFMKRAPGFFDEVCYTQTSTSGDQVVAHSLTVAPELVIIKSRNQSYAWNVWPVALNNRLVLNQNSAASTFGPISGVTSTSFLEPMYQLGTPIGTTYVTYLFASCPGVSKVGSYTGNDDVQTINCGFTGGARFVMIKRTDSAEDWFVFDTARGINAGDDKILSLNTTAAEVTNRNNVSPASVGFEVNNDGGFCNASGGTYIFLAIA